jgi:hypothetical protein
MSDMAISRQSSRLGGIKHGHIRQIDPRFRQLHAEPVGLAILCFWNETDQEAIRDKTVDHCQGSIQTLLVSRGKCLPSRLASQLL